MDPDPVEAGLDSDEAGLQRPARQNWATWLDVPHLEQRRREVSVWTSILLSVQPSASTSETKAGSVNQGATSMEMWAILLAALVNTLSLLSKTRVTQPNWLKRSLMAASGSEAGTPVRRTAVTASPGDQP